MSYILLDISNTFFRARHVVRGDDIELKTGMALNIIFSSINKVWRDFDGKHVVVACDARSWRKDFYPPYKAQRREQREAMTAREAAEDAKFFEVFDDFKSFLKEYTNVTVLQQDGCEADDFIARWIQNHPNNKHIIISSDSDYYQLLSPTVSQYNGVTNQHIKIDGVFDHNDKPIIDKKTKTHKKIGDPEWLLFEKCIRGDTSDNIFSAYPGARLKGTKNKIGLIDAFSDRNTQGFNWNNFMLQRWTDHKGNERIVKDEYERNKTLIDLTAQPKGIKQLLDEEIEREKARSPKSQIGIRLMKFCGKYGLTRIGEASQEHTRYLSALYE
jgi:5'-3' exonuclease